MGLRGSRVPETASAGLKVVKVEGLSGTGQGAALKNWQVPSEGGPVSRLLNEIDGTMLKTQLNKEALFEPPEDSRGF
jgi:hypothetical protein